MEKTIAIIAKSAKGSGFCVVGIDIEKNNFVRLVSSNNASTNEISDSYMTYADNTKVNVLDIAKFKIKKHLPDKFQVENYLIDSSYSPSKVNNLKISDLETYISKSKYIYINTEEKLNKEEMSKTKNSISIFKITNLRLFPRFHSSKNCWAYFKYNDFEYKRFRVTDIIFKDLKSQKNIYEALIVVTLPANPYVHNDSYYKIIAKIFPLK